ncbi:Sip1-related alpha-galactosidase [Luteolibacter sp. AS25]|uniref:Sip1-related alpha-galactosidase n=1 Tax=Luteolibacter sp. AS25 TaxID=3135776 RepID=UPI00398ADED2
MKLNPLLLTLSGLLALFPLHAESLAISGAATGLLTQTVEGLKSGKDGTGLSREIELPEFSRGAYYRPHSESTAWGNRVEAVAFDSIEDLENYSPSKTRKGHSKVQEGQFILLELKDGRYLALLPMTSEKVFGQFFLENGKLLLKTGNFGTDAVDGEIPLICWAYGDSPYAATEAVWDQVLKSGNVAAQPRSGKSYPEEPYGYLGWCSWEFYKTKISEEIISDAFHTIEDSGAPIRWLMVDDGYLDEKGRRLVSFGVDKKKFPNGWEPIMNLKDPEKIKWVGVWRNFGGYMSGVSAQHTMKDLKSDLKNMKKKGTVLPYGSKEASKAFYDEMVSDTKESGFDFVKVDFHARTFDHYKGMPDPIGAMRANNEALEEATHEMGIPLLNCIAQPNINSLQTKYSALTRSSPDYNQSDKDKNKCNTYQSFANHLWMGQTVWGDLDMFHTHDERDVNPMAIARAISGGPVYISDEPSKIVPEVLTPFAYEDGKLLRTSAPATLLPESFFIHPFRDNDVFRVIAPMEDGVAAIALFNFTEGGKSLKGSIRPKDYTYAGELLQPNSGAWTAPAEGLLVYDREAKSIVDLEDDFSSEVPNFDAKLFLLYPKSNGWAVIGRTDKYLPAAAVKVKESTKDQIVFTLAESGPLAIWSETGAPKMDGANFESIGENLYMADLPVEAGEVEITVTR